MKRLSLMLALAAITTSAADAANYTPRAPKKLKAKTVTDEKMVKKMVKKKPLKAVAVSR